MILRSLRLTLVGLSVLPAALLAASPAAQQQPLPAELDLATAVSFALENNFAIRQARERIREQEGVILEVNAQRLPNVGVGANYQRNAEEISQGFPADDSTWLIQIQASQALYAGGGISASVNAARSVREAAVFELQQVINDSLLGVRTQFYNVLLARESIKVREQSVALLNEQLTNARNRFEAGASSSFEVLRAEVALANAQPPLIQARNAYRIAIEELRQFLGARPNSAADLTGDTVRIVGELSFQPATYELGTALEAARANRPELARYGKLVDAQQQNVRQARSGYYPGVDLVAGYQWQKGSDSDRFRDADEGWLVGVQSQWNIFDGRRTAGRVVQARSALAQTELAQSEVELGVEVEVRRAHSSLQEAKELVQSSQQVVRQAEEALRLATARQTAGTATQLDVLTSQVDLTNARNNELQANYNYLVALAQLRKAMGQADQFASNSR